MEPARCLMVAGLALLSATSISRAGPASQHDYDPNAPVTEEEPCTREGGLCMPSTYCPNGLSPKKGLCPLRQKYEVECCIDESVLKNRCRLNGGECMDYCAPFLQRGPRGCGDNQVCCVLI
ncbi:U-scoloptoxin(19)-Sm1a-like [Periplaneta americana]|uniref:U-scoloptoxin(19)-Sm1a-like n=1 Tax=Periplaneta americana TaxID=6978 RepID=UPI0037E6FFA9